MIKHHATAEDFARWTEWARGATVAALRYAVRDCFMAARALGPDHPRQGYYTDQAAEYASELRRRGEEV